MKKMRERLAISHGAPPFDAHLRAVARVSVLGRRGVPINVVRDLYLLSLETAKQRGVCPDPANDNGAERARSQLP